MVERLKVPMVGNAKRSNFEGFREEIAASNRTAASFDAMASQVFSDAAHNARRKGEQAGRSALAMNADGTFTQLEAPDAGSIFTEAFVDEQRQAYLAATSMSMEEKTKDLLQKYEHDKDRSANFQRDFQQLAQTFIGSAPENSKQAIALQAQILAAQGQRKMDAVTVAEEREVARVAINTKLNTRLDKLYELGRSLAGDEVSDLDPQFDAEAFVEFSSFKKELEEAFSVGALTPQQRQDLYEAASVALASGKLMEELSAAKKVGKDELAALTAFENDTGKFQGQNISKKQRSAIAQEVRASIIQRKQLANQARIERDQAQAIAVKNAQTELTLLETNGTLITAELVRRIYTKHGGDLQHYETRLQAQKAIQSGVTDARDLAITGAIEDMKRSTSLNARAMKLARDYAKTPAEVAKVEGAITTHWNRIKKEWDGLNAEAAKRVINDEIAAGDIEEDGLRAISQDALISIQKGVKPNRFQKYVMENLDSLKDMVEKARIKKTGLTLGQYNIWERFQKTGRISGQETADVVGKMQGVSFDDPLGVAQFALQNNGYIPKHVVDDFTSVAGGEGYARSAFQAATIVIALEQGHRNAAVAQRHLPDAFKTPLMLAVKDYVKNNINLSNGKQDENFVSEMDKLDKFIKSFSPTVPEEMRETVRQFTANASSFVSNYIEENKPSFFARFFGPSNKAEEINLMSNPSRETISFLERNFKNEIRITPHNPNGAMERSIGNLLTKRVYGVSRFGHDPINSDYERPAMMFAPESMRGNIGHTFREYPEDAATYLVSSALRAAGADLKQFEGPRTIADKQAQGFYLIPDMGAPNSARSASYTLKIRDKSGEYRDFKVTINDEIASQITQYASVLKSLRTAYQSSKQYGPISGVDEVAVKALRSPTMQSVMKRQLERIEESALDPDNPLMSAFVTAGNIADLLSGNAKERDLSVPRRAGDPQE
ncbi:MAG: hypothetical protein VW498_02015 [Candidatus Thalassarchaeaceae archaeon]